MLVQTYVKVVTLPSALGFFSFHPSQSYLCFLDTDRSKAKPYRGLNPFLQIRFLKH